MNRKVKILIGLLALLVVMPGCWGDPPLQKITGKVTLKGKSYNRLLVYFYPKNKKTGRAYQFQNGTGETNAKGELVVACTQGQGLEAGKYTVSFSCAKTIGGGTNNPDEKADDNPNVKVVEQVPAPYDQATNAKTSPVEFEVKAGEENVFNFDIPAK